MKITKITLETTEGKEIELTPEQARELYTELESLFGGGHNEKYTYGWRNPLLKQPAVPPVSGWGGIYGKGVG